MHSVKLEICARKVPSIDSNITFHEEKRGTNPQTEDNGSDLKCLEPVERKRKRKETDLRDNKNTMTSLSNCQNVVSKMHTHVWCAQMLLF